jgi:anthranilate/para-aminobenzoate synthase component II
VRHILAFVASPFPTLGVCLGVYCVLACLDYA